MHPIRRDSDYNSRFIDMEASNVNNVESPSLKNKKEPTEDGKARKEQSGCKERWGGKYRVYTGKTP